MKTTVIIRGQITKQNDIINTQLYNIGSNCKIKILTIVLCPNYPAGGNYSRNERQFKVSSDLVTRPTFSPIGEQQTDTTPLFIYMHRVVRDEKIIVWNYTEDYFQINNPSTYSQFFISELPPFPIVAIEAKNNYWFDVSLHLAIEIPD